MKYSYIALINGKITAFHNKKSVMKEYLRLYKNSNPNDECFMGKMTRKKAEKVTHYSDWYLEDVGDTYVQSIFVDAYFIMLDMSYSETINGMIEELWKAAAREESKKKTRKILASIEILSEMQSGRNSYTPSFQVLQEEYWKVEEYRNKIGG